MVLICLSSRVAFQSLSMPFSLSLFLFSFSLPVSLFSQPHCLSILPRPTCSCLPCLFLFSLPHHLPASQSRPAFSFSSGLYFSAPDVPPVANIVFLPPRLDMAKEAICALLAILGHFFEAFSPLDLFSALASFHLASSAFPCFRPSRFPSLSLAALPHQSPLAPSCACQPRAVRTRPLSTHAGF